MSRRRVVACLNRAFSRQLFQISNLALRTDPQATAGLRDSIIPASDPVWRSEIQSSIASDGGDGPAAAAAQKSPLRRFGIIHTCYCIRIRRCNQ